MSDTSLRLPVAGSPIPADHHAPLAHGLIGVVALLVGALLLVSASDTLALGHWGAPAIVGAVHVFTLGWLVTLVVGTLYQLGPVALRVQPRRGRLWRWVLPLHTIGVGLVVWGTSTGRLHTAAHGWSLVTVGLIITTAVQLGPFRAPAETRARARLVATAFALLGLTLVVAASRLAWGWLGFMPDLMGLRLAHVALGLGGFGTLIAWAVGGHVIPMFLGTREPGSLLGRMIPVLLVVGVLLALVAVLPPIRWLQAPAVLLLAFAQALLCLHGWRWFRARASRSLDPALALVAVAFVSLFCATMLQFTLGVGVLGGLVDLSTDTGRRLLTAWGVLALPGWLSLLIAGVLFRVFVFVSWMVREGPGTAARTPPIRVTQFARPGMAWASVACFSAGLTMLCAGIVVAHSAGVRIGSIAYATGAALMLLHHTLALFAPPRTHGPALSATPITTSSKATPIPSPTGA